MKTTTFLVGGLLAFALATATQRAYSQTGTGGGDPGPAEWAAITNGLSADQLSALLGPETTLLEDPAPIEELPGPPILSAEHLINVDFYSGVPAKQGGAAIGYGLFDYWNHYDFPQAYVGTIVPLLYSDGLSSGAVLEVQNAPGQWGFAVPDPMYQGYIYPWNGGSITVTITNLPANVDGVGPFRYRWYRTDLNYCSEVLLSDSISASSSGTFTIASVSPVDEGNYRVQVDDVNLCAAYGYCHLSLSGSRLAQPAFSPAYEGPSSLRITFVVAGTSDGRVYYTTDGTCPSRATLGSSTFATDVGGSVVVPPGAQITAFASRSDIAGNTTADSLISAWRIPEPYVIPDSATVATGGSIQFCVVALNPSPTILPTWRFNGGPILASSTCLTLSGLTVADSGLYTAEVIRTIGIQGVGSSQLTVTPP